MFQKALHNVFILTNTLLPGGAEKQSIYLANALSKNFQTQLVVYYGEKYDQKLVRLAESYNISIIWLEGSHIRKWLLLYKLFRSSSNTVVFSYLATTNLINALIGKLSKVKLRIGGIRSSQISVLKLVIQRFLHNQLLSCTVFNSYAGMKALTNKGFNPKKSIVIPNCIDLSDNSSERSQPKEKIQIITVGRFVKAKDFNTALLAIKILRDNLSISQQNFSYLIIGFGELENEIRALIEKYELSEIVKVIVNPENTDSFYKESDIFLSTSVFEGLSNAIMEAMAYSLPVVATNVGDSSRLVLDGESGYIVEQKNYQEIAQRLKELCNSQSKRIEMGDKGHKHVHQNFSPQAFKEQYLSLINRLINEA